MQLTFIQTVPDNNNQYSNVISRVWILKAYAFFFYCSKTKLYVISYKFDLYYLLWKLSTQNYSLVFVVTPYSLLFLLIFTYKMPKINDCILRNFVKEFSEDIISCDNAVLFCKVCGVKVSAEKSFYNYYLFIFYKLT